jgi:hypothetical protein
MSVTNTTVNGVLVPTGATVYTKASIFKIVNGATISIDGNVSLRMDIVDGMQTDSTGDQIAFTVLSSKDSSLYYSNDWEYDAYIMGWRSKLQGVINGVGSGVSIS